MTSVKLSGRRSGEIFSGDRKRVSGLKRGEMVCAFWEDMEKCRPPALSFVVTALIFNDRKDELFS